MTTLREYLDKTDCKDDLKDLIELIAMQAVPIRDAFIYNQSYAGTENSSGDKQAALDVWSDEHIICHKTGINPYQNLPVSDKTISNLQYQYTNINFTVQLNDIKFNNIQYDILKSINLTISNLGYRIPA